MNYIFRLAFVLLQLLKNIDVLYYLSYGLFAFIGTVIHPFFFAFHLSEILIRYPTLKNVIRSVWTPRLAIILTFVLFLIIIYVFTLIAFTFFAKDYE